MEKKKDDISFTADETQRRFESALRGARIAGPKHTKATAVKQAKPPRKKK